MFLANFLIALREGIEAALIVAILVTYIVKVNRRDVLPHMWIGVVIAAVVPLAAGAYMTWGPYTLSFEAQEILGGTLSIIAVIFVSWMIFWMAGHAKNLSHNIQATAGEALESGSSWALIWLAIISVGREGVETAVFVWGVVKSGTDALGSNASAASTVWMPILGVLSGLVVAIIFGYLIYKGTARINLKAFFTITGYLLIFVAAGIVAYGIGDLQEANVLPGWGEHIYDLITPLGTIVGSWWFVVLDAMFQVQTVLAPTLIQFIGWAGYLAITLTAFARASHGGQTDAKAQPSEVEPADDVKQLATSVKE